MYFSLALGTTVLISPIPIACQPEAIGIALILEVDQELESSVYSKKRLTFSGRFLL